MLDTIDRPITDPSVLNAVKTAPELQVVADPTRRFGYNPCVPNLSMSPSGSGLNSPIVEPGKLLMFVPRVAYHRGMFNPLTGTYPRITTRKYPNEYACAVKLQFQDKKDFGYRNLEMLTSLEYRVTADGYYDEGYKYWEVVHRTISCEFGLETYVPHEHGDDTFQPCPTCRIADLKSPSLQQAIATSGLDMSILEQLRLTLIQANEAAIRNITQRLDGLDGELEIAKTGQPGRRFYTESDKYFMKMIHRKPKGDQQVDLLQQTIQANAQAIQMAMTAQAPQPAPVQQGQVELSPAEYQEYLELKAKQEAVRARMATARAAKKTEVTNEHNDTGGNVTEPERTDGQDGE